MMSTAPVGYLGVKYPGVGIWGRVSREGFPGGYGIQGRVCPPPDTLPFLELQKQAVHILVDCFLVDTDSFAVFPRCSNPFEFMFWGIWQIEVD